MGKRRRGNRSATVLDREPEGDRNDIVAQKRLRISSAQVLISKLRLSEDQEDRLGRWSSSVQWIMKIAQDRGCNTCLAFSSTEVSDQSIDGCKFIMKSFDGQQISIIVRGGWADKAANVLARAGGREVILLSGIGAKIPSSGSEVNFHSDKMIAEVINAVSLQSKGCFEVVDGQVVSMPRQMVDIEESDVVQVSDQEHETREKAVAEEAQLRSSPLTDPSPIQTPLRNNRLTRQATSVTPGWLKTPASDNSNRRNVANPKSSREESEVAFSFTKNSNTSSANEKTINTRIYTPIGLLKCDDKVPYNTIGLITSDKTARRALSGTRDWKITIDLIDLEESKVPLVVPFNLFSREESWLPRSKPGCILLLRGIKVRPFNSNPQGSGYAGQYDWALIDTANSDGDDALTCSEENNLSTAEKEEVKRLHTWYRKHHKGLVPAIVSTRNRRPLIKLHDVEKEIFFDTTVEIVKIWTGSPPTIYVTDYTTHPQFYAANDVHLDGFSREELYEQQEECNDAGNGRVLPISLWDEQQRVIEHVHTGMLVRLENVRPKMQPNNYLSGTMGGSIRGFEEKMKVILVKESQTIEEFLQKKEDYLQEVAIRRAEKPSVANQRGRRQGMEEREDTASEYLNLSNNASDFRIPSLMPPPGQKPLSIIENRVYEKASETPTSTKTTDSQVSSEQEEVPTLIEEKYSSLALTPLSELHHMPLDQLREEQTFVCLGRVYDMKPENLDSIVDVSCGLCKSRLPADEAFCSPCAEEEGKELQYKFNLALLIETVDTRDHDNEEAVRIPILVRGEEARHFLHGFHPKDVRNRTSTFDRLKQRLLPLLGSELVDKNNSQEQKKPQPFRFVIRASTIFSKADGMLHKRFFLTGTRLGKA